MSAEELLDVFDEMGRHAGVRDRHTAHREGWWHQVFHLLIVATRDGTPTVILQRRSSTKLTFPGLIDLTATGHLGAGEQPIEGRRELREELGVELAPEAMVPLGIRRIVDSTPEGLNREFCHVFVALDDRPLSAYRPDPAEVDGVVEVRLDDAIDLMAGVVATARGSEAGPAGTVAVELGGSDFVPEPPLEDLDPAAGSYWVAVLTAAQRVANGDRRVSI